MWVRFEAGQEPEVFVNSGTSDISASLRAGHPGASIYRSTDPTAYRTAASHRNATQVIWRDVEEPGPDDAEGNPTTITVQIPERVGLGNALAIDPAGPTLQLKDHTGAVIGTVPLELVT